MAASRRGPGFGSPVRPFRWPGQGPCPALSGRPLLRCVSGPAADPVSRRAAVCVSLCGPCGPCSARQRVPGPVASASRPGIPPARRGPSCSNCFLLFTPVGPKGRSSAPRPDHGAYVRAQTGVIYTTGPVSGFHASAFRAEVLGRWRFARSLPSAPAPLASPLVPGWASGRRRPRPRPLGARCPRGFSLF